MIHYFSLISMLPAGQMQQNLEKTSYAAFLSCIDVDALRLPAPRLTVATSSSVTPNPLDISFCFTNRPRKPCALPLNLTVWIFYKFVHSSCTVCLFTSRRDALAPPAGCTIFFHSLFRPFFSFVSALQCFSTHSSDCLRYS